MKQIPLTAAMAFAALAGGTGTLSAQAISLEDDGEFGGEAVGRAVWEWYEARLKEWETQDKERVMAEEEQAAREKAEVEAEEKGAEAEGASKAAASEAGPAPSS